MENGTAFEQELAYGQRALALAAEEYSDVEEHYFLGYLRGLERARELLGGAQ